MAVAAAINNSALSGGLGLTEISDEGETMQKIKAEFVEYVKEVLTKTSS